MMVSRKETTHNLVINFIVCHKWNLSGVVTLLVQWWTVNFILGIYYVFLSNLSKTLETQLIFLGIIYLYFLKLRLIGERNGASH